MAARSAGLVGADPKSGAKVDRLMQGPIGWLGQLAGAGEEGGETPMAIGPVSRAVERAIPSPSSD